MFKIGDRVFVQIKNFPKFECIAIIKAIDKNSYYPYTIKYLSGPAEGDDIPHDGHNFHKIIEPNSIMKELLDK